MGAAAASSLVFPLHVFAHKRSRSIPTSTRSFPLEAVRLAPSMYLDSLNANIRYLYELEPDRQSFEPAAIVLTREFPWNR